MANKHPLQVEKAKLLASAVSTENLDFFPAEDMLLLEFIKGGDQTAGGIVIPEAMQEQMMPRWKVVARGPGKFSHTRGERVPIAYELGDEVIISQQRGQMFEVPGRRVRHVLASEAAILAVVRDRKRLEDLQ